MTIKPSHLLVRTLVVLGLLTAGWLRQPAAVVAQGAITITSPAQNAVLRAGPDFATDVLADPWDFSNRADAAIDPAQIDGFTNFAVTGGLAGGTISLRRDGSGGGSFFNILQRGYYGILNPGRTGRRFPINSGAYTKLSFKMSSANGNQFPRVYWFHNDAGHPAGEGTGWRFVTDIVASPLPTPSGTHIFTLDMRQNNNLSPWIAGGVQALALYPNSTAETGYPVQFDWVRLTTGDDNPAASTILPVTWSGGSGATTIQVTDAGGTPLTVATVASGTTYNWNYGVLPPGTYTMTITRGASTSAPRTFTINAPPVIQVTDPDEAGGEDFATAVLGNAWDMSDQGDYKVDPGTINDHLISRSISASGIFTGRSDGQTVAFTSGGIPVGDPQMYFLSKGKDGDTTVIDTQKYHRLTFNLAVDGAFDLERGSVSRVFWGGTTTPSGGGAPYTGLTTSKDIITWPGTNTYTVDLAPLTAAADGGLEALPVGGRTWTGQNVRHFRLDPHEFADQRDFNYDYVKLAADDETTNSSFTIRFAAADPDGTSGSIALYYDTDLNPATSLTLITSGLPLTATQYVWNTGQVPSGTYYIYAVVTDGLNASAQYSTGPVKVSTFTPVSNAFISLDAPAPGAVVTSAIEVAGWALDLASSSGPGIDAVHFYIFPEGGAGPGVYVGSGTYGGTRADVGALFGSQFTNSGVHFTITGMGPGNYVLGAFGHSTVSNTFSAVTMVPITVNANALMSIDLPAPEAIVTSRNFTVAGWAIDRLAQAGTGVDALHLYTFHNPGSGEAPVFLGIATLGIARSDVASLYGARFTNSGYVLPVDWNALGLGAGLYNIAVVAHSTATGTFNNVAVVQIRVQ